jgi:hypothetical protein
MSNKLLKNRLRGKTCSTCVYLEKWQNESKASTPSGQCIRVNYTYIPVDDINTHTCEYYKSVKHVNWFLM